MRYVSACRLISWMCMCILCCSVEIKKCAFCFSKIAKVKHLATITTTQQTKMQCHHHTFTREVIEKIWILDDQKSTLKKIVVEEAGRSDTWNITILQAGSQDTQTEATGKVKCVAVYFLLLYILYMDSYTFSALKRYLPSSWYLCIFVTLKLF